MGDLTWLNETLGYVGMVWERAEPWVSAIVNIATVLGLAWGGWLFLRLKVLPHTRFGVHASVITARLQQLDNAIKVEDRLAGNPAKYVTYFASHLLLTLGAIAMLCVVGFNVSEMSIRLPLMILILLGVAVRDGRVMNTCEYLLDPTKALIRTIHLVDSRATRALATGVVDESMVKLKARMEALKAKIAEKRKSTTPSSPTDDTAVDAS